MKKTRKWLLVAGFVPILTLTPAALNADGDDDASHGRPEIGGDAVVTSKWTLDTDRTVADEGEWLPPVAVEAFDPLEGLWTNIDRVLGINR